jgi:hypothetical protein
LATRHQGAGGFLGPRRIISLSMVKNEQDIIEPFIRHNARFVDCMVILDNASVDQTRRIATSCARELGNIVVTDNEEFGFTQAERMTRVLNGCQSVFFADFVLLLDADEFIGVPDRATLERALARIPAGGVGHLPWRNAVLTPEEAEAEVYDAPRCMRHYRTAEACVFHKAVLRLDGDYRPDLLIEQGNHEVSTTSGARLPSLVLNDVPLLHFPIRSRQQVANKAIVGWAAYVCKDPFARRATYGRQWRETFDRIVAGGLSPLQLAELSLRYGWPAANIGWAGDVVAWEPPSDYQRIYSSGAPGEPLAVTALSWERSLSRPQDGLAGVPAAGCLDIPPIRFAMDKLAPAGVLELGGANYLALFRHLGCADTACADTACGNRGQDAPADLRQPLDLGRVFDMVVCPSALGADAAALGMITETAARHASAAILLAPSACSAASTEVGESCAIAEPLAWFARQGWYPDLVDSLGMRALATWPRLRRELVVLRRGDRLAGEAAASFLVALDAAAQSVRASESGVCHYAFSIAAPQVGQAGLMGW